MANDGSKYCEDFLLRKEGRSKVSNKGKTFYLSCVLLLEKDSQTSDHNHCGFKESHITCENDIEQLITDAYKI